MIIYKKHINELIQKYLNNGRKLIKHVEYLIPKSQSCNRKKIN